MTADEVQNLRQQLLDDETTAETANELEMSVEAYVQATIIFCQNPERGFLGQGIQPEGSSDDAPAEKSTQLN